MEELKELISAIANIPNLAVWVIVAYLAYKVVVVGSIYGVLRFAISKLHDWAVMRKTRREEVQIEVVLDGVVMSSSKNGLINQLRRVASICNRGSTVAHEGRMYFDSVDWLKDAIDMKIAADEAKEGGK